MNSKNCLVHVNLSKSYRGGEIQMVELMHSLTRFYSNQIAVCRKNSPLSKKLKNNKYIILIEVSGPLDGHFRHKIKKENSIIHAHEARAVYWAWIEFLLRKTSYIITRRVINPIGSSRLTRAAYRSASQLIAVSRFAATILQGRIDKNVDVIMDCTRDISIEQESSGLKYDLSGDPVIGHIGEFDVAVKGQDLLIEAFLIFLQNYPNSKLYLIGGGKDFEEYKMRYKHEDRIIFVGRVQDVSLYLDRLDVFCFPSRVEALGSSVLEAMSVGVPVLVSSAGGLPELADNGRYATVVNAFDPEHWAMALTKTVQQVDNTQAMVSRAKSFAVNNSAAKMVEAYYEIYSKM